MSVDLPVGSIKGRVTDAATGKEILFRAENNTATM